MKPNYSRALIIGAGAGLSASLARLFAANGLGLALAARATDKLAALAAETGASLHTCDVADQGQALRQPPLGCIHYSDHGSQYYSGDYQKRLKKHGFQISMSGNGNCFDNAMVESFFKTLKAELIWRHRWSTRRQAEMALFGYINRFYNPRAALSPQPEKPAEI